jgi:hypothetical protein
MAETREVRLEAWNNLDWSTVELHRTLRQASKIPATSALLQIINRMSQNDPIITFILNNSVTSHAGSLRLLNKHSGINQRMSTSSQGRKAYHHKLLMTASF